MSTAQNVPEAPSAGGAEVWRSGLLRLREEAARTPEEVVGLWWEHRGMGLPGELLFSLAENVAADPVTGWELDSAPLMSALDEGWSLRGVGHSHPGGRMEPSNVDYATARRLGSGVRQFLVARTNGGWATVEYGEGWNARLGVR